MSEELKPTDEQCDRIVALTMDKLAAKGCDQYGDMHALDLNPNIMEHHSLRRSIVRAAYGVGEAEAIATWNRRAQPEPAAPSVAPEPVAWTTLIEIDWVKRNAGRAGSFYAVKAGPNDIPLFAHPPRAPLTEEQLLEILGDIDPQTKRLPPGVQAFARAIEAAHQIGENNG